MNQRNFSRRGFLKTAIAAWASIQIVPSRVFGANSKPGLAGVGKGAAPVSGCLETGAVPFSGLAKGTVPFSQRREKGTAPFVRCGRSLRPQGLRQVAPGSALPRFSRDAPDRRQQDRRRVRGHAGPHACPDCHGGAAAPEARLLRQAADAHDSRSPDGHRGGPARRRRHASHRLTQHLRGRLPHL